MSFDELWEAGPLGLGRRDGGRGTGEGGGGGGRTAGCGAGPKPPAADAANTGPIVGEPIGADGLKE
ncbi:MAG: hypothetical protein ACJ79I_05165, partial [Gemmatimonadaceae bacterium]